MKKYFFLLFAFLFFTPLSMWAQVPENTTINSDPTFPVNPICDSAGIVGGAGIIKTRCSPNVVSSLRTIDQRFSGSIAWDTLNQIMYRYYYTQPQGSRWVRADSSSIAQTIIRDSQIVIYKETAFTGTYTQNLNFFKFMHFGSSAMRDSWYGYVFTSTDFNSTLTVTNCGPNMQTGATTATIKNGYILYVKYANGVSSPPARHYVITGGWGQANTALANAATPTHTLTNSSNTLTSTVNGVAATAAAVISNTFTAGSSAFSSSVNGVTANLTPSAGTIANTLGFDSGGNLVKQAPVTSGISSLNGLTSATQTFANGSAGTAPSVSSVSGVHTFNQPLASGAGVTSGTISKTDYDNFLNKWSLTGNSGTVAGTNFLGTTDAQNLIVKTNSVERARFDIYGLKTIGGSAANPSISFIGTTHGIFTDYRNDLLFSINGTTRLELTPTARLVLNSPNALNTFLGYAGNDTGTGIQNVATGYSMPYFTTGSYNAAYGTSTAIGLTTGSFNSFFGQSAGTNTSTGSNNNAFGYSALTANTTGSNNNVFGTCLQSAQGNSNSAFGVSCFQQVQGSQNTGIGYYAASGVSEGNNNIYIGNGAGQAKLKSESSVVLGDFSQTGVYDLSNCVGIGNGLFNLSYQINANNYSTNIHTVTNASGGVLTVTPLLPASFVGKVITVRANTGLPTGAPTNATWYNITVLSTSTIQDNAVTGTQTGGTFTRYVDLLTNSVQIANQSFNTKSNQVLLGNSALQELSLKEHIFKFDLTDNSILKLNTPFYTPSISTNNGTLTTPAHNILNTSTGFNGTNNIFEIVVGGTLKTSILSSGIIKPNSTNTLMGSGVGNPTGNNNILLGQSGLSLTTGSHNIFSGLNTGNATTTGNANVASGTFSLENNISGSYNVAEGWTAGRNNTADFNTFIGSNAGINHTSGTPVLALGYNASVGTTANNAVALGPNASADYDNSIAVGANAFTTAANQMKLGANTLTQIVVGGGKITNQPTTGMTGSDVITVTQSDATYAKKPIRITSPTITATILPNTTYYQNITVTGVTTNSVVQAQQFQYGASSGSSTSNSIITATPIANDTVQIQIFVSGSGNAIVNSSVYLNVIY